MDFVEKLEYYASLGLIPPRDKRLFLQFYTEHTKALQTNGIDPAPYHPLFLSFLEKFKEQIASPHSFSHYHQRIRKPFDYYKLGLDLIRPLIDIPHSSVQDHKILQEIAQKLQEGENVIFLSNHQSEADPHALSLLLEERYPDLAEQLICVAGDRVLTDPFAIPFSMGRNLLCIYSKRHIDNPPEQKQQKQLYNKKTMERMSELLSEGGRAIYVAPSGGRDRADASGIIHVAPFDPQSIEMLCLMASKASKPTSFYPMALSTYNLLPPPKTVEKELGEERKAGYGAAHLWVGPKISMDNFPGDKHSKRKNRALFIWSQVEQAYRNFSCK